MIFEQNAARSIEDCRVLIVDDQETSLLIMATLLEDLAQCETVNSASDALAACEKQLPDLIITDVNMPGMSGHELCQLLRKSPETAQLPVMFVTASDSDEEQEKCWQAGGVDFVTKPIHATTFRNRVKFQLSHKLKTDLLETLIYTDRLTGAFNRHYMDERLPSIVKEAQRENQPLAVAIFDIDYFKQYNDQYGHMAGDSCLWKLATAVRQNLMRPMDHLIRVGGEEFLVLLPRTETEGAEVVCHRMLETVSGLNIAHQRSEFGHVTVSIGLSIYHPAQSATIEDVLLQADKCLYQAKASGRNQLAQAD
ncbi:diguanylate cyclase [Salinimonas sediminis]|uniref:diguanylate cyclase n=1 Tax=Salinimonas sediminis TaxID=2303538 RepID=A0A346NQJ6_9ALTE|nr:diguanylate cyclase [Salinimonas sediminis]AXR07803.1 diguanylate cyclase [Salinimonas sediminis]